MTSGMGLAVRGTYHRASAQPLHGQSSLARGYEPRTRIISASRRRSSRAAAHGADAASASTSTQNRYSHREPRPVHGRDSRRDRLIPREANASSERPSEPGTLRFCLTLPLRFDFG